MKFFNYVTLLVAITISACAAYYSIVGLTAIFAAAFWPIVIMGTALELGKLTGAVWLHLNWKNAQWWIRMYMVPAVAILMLITSMGIFGFLSRAHIEQTANVVDVTTKIEQLNLDVGIQQQKIDNNKKIISQLDGAVDSLIGAATTQGQEKARSNAREARRAAEEARKLRQSQDEERTRLQTEISQASDKLAAINKEKLILEQQAKKIEAEVGPIKYVAALFYGDNPDVNTLERAVRWMIVILVVVFDPLAVVLILAATSGFTYNRQKPVLPVNKETDWGPDVGKEIVTYEEEPKKNLEEIQTQETLLPESLSEPSESPKKSTRPRSKKSL